MNKSSFIKPTNINIIKLISSKALIKFFFLILYTFSFQKDWDGYRGLEKKLDIYKLDAIIQITIKTIILYTHIAVVNKLSAPIV